MSLRYALYVLRTNPRYMVGIAIVLLVVLGGALAPWITPYDPVEARLDHVLLPPGPDHWMGTDRSGMDIFTRVVWAPRIDLAIAISAVLISVLIGVPLGLLAGYERGFVGTAISRGSDVLQAFPIFVLAMGFMAVTGGNVHNVIWVLGFVNVPVYLKLVRAQVLSLREREFVEAARAIGLGKRDILFRELLPNALAPCFVQLSVNVGLNILLAAGLSFIGAGVPVPAAEWGIMIAIGAEDLITGHWWPSLFPGIAMGVTVMGFALLGEFFGEIADPAKRR
jgi:peptide/nickel transport system permease protein